MSQREGSERRSRASWLLAASGLMTMPAAAATWPGQALESGQGGDSSPVVFNGEVRADGDGGACDSVPTRVEAGAERPIEVAAEIEAKFAPPADGALAIAVPSVSSVVVRNGSSEQLEVTLCKRAWAATPERAEALLGAVEINLDGARLTATGPDESPDAVWSANLIVDVPEGLALDLRADRGSITLRQTTRDIRAYTQSGGIFAAPAGGTVALASVNGSIDLYLPVATWDGQGVAATSQNGSLSARLGSAPPFAAMSAESRFGAVQVGDEELQGRLLASAVEVDEDSEPKLVLATVNGPLFVDRAE